MSRPRVAVLIPSFNHARFLPATLASVLAQTLRPAEILVLDDGSTDGSAAVAEQILGGTTGINWSVLSRPNRGISATRNELFARSRAEWVAFLDSDDLYAPDRLERMLEGAPAGRPWLAFSGVRVRHEGRGAAAEECAAWREMYRLRLGQAAILPTVGFALLRSNLALTASNLVMNREMFERVGGFDEGIRICQDWDFLVQALPHAEPCFVPYPLLEYRVHGDNTSRDAALTAAHELDTVWRKAAVWLGQTTPSRCAPGPANWPRYYRWFARLHAPRGQTALPIGPVGAIPDHPERARQEEAALQALVQEASLGHDYAGDDEQELMGRCARRWEGVN